MKAHQDLIMKFYSAFQEMDSDGMAECYHKNIEFKDPAFGVLNGDHVMNMWRMLIDRSKGELVVTYDNVMADQDAGICHWEAYYKFGKTGRKVHNKIQATMRFQDGLIVEHHDHFSIWKWSSMALGVPGTLLGWSPMIKNKIRSNCLSLLAKYEELEQSET